MPLAAKQRSSAPHPGLLASRAENSPPGQNQPPPQTNGISGPPNGTVHWAWRLHSYENRGGPVCSTYFRDSETGLDYAQNRYHRPGEGRFMTPDPYMGSASPADPGSWNRYAYVGGDPVNRIDPFGLCDVIIGGITQSDNPDFGVYAGSHGDIQAYPYAGGTIPGGVFDVATLSPGDVEVQVVIDAIMAAAADPGPINVIAYSGGAGAFAVAYWELPSDVRYRIASVAYFSPGANGYIPTTAFGPNALFLSGSDGVSDAAEVATKSWLPPIETNCDHTQVGCFIAAASQFLDNHTSSPCSSPAVYSRSGGGRALIRGPRVSVRPGFGPYWTGPQAAVEPDPGAAIYPASPSDPKFWDFVNMYFMQLGTGESVSSTINFTF